MKKILVVASVIASVGLSSASAMDALKWKEAKKAKETEEAQTARAAQSRIITPQRSVVATKIEAAEQKKSELIEGVDYYTAKDREMLEQKKGTGVRIISKPTPYKTAPPADQPPTLPKALDSAAKKRGSSFGVEAEDREALRVTRMNDLGVDTSKSSMLYEQNKKMEDELTDLIKKRDLAKASGQNREAIESKIADLNRKLSNYKTDIKIALQEEDIKALQVEIGNMKRANLDTNKKEAQLNDLKAETRSIQLDKEIKFLDENNLDNKQKIAALKTERFGIQEETAINKKIAELRGKTLSAQDGKKLDELKGQQLVIKEMMRLNKSNDSFDLAIRDDIRGVIGLQSQIETQINQQKALSRDYSKSKSSEDKKRLKQIELELDSNKKKLDEFLTTKFSEDDPRYIQKVNIQIKNLQAIPGKEKELSDLYANLNAAYDQQRSKSPAARKVSVLNQEQNNLVKKRDDLNAQIEPIQKKYNNLIKSKVNQTLRASYIKDLKKQIEEFNNQKAEVLKDIEKLVVATVLAEKALSKVKPKPLPRPTSKIKASEQKEQVLDTRTEYQKIVARQEWFSDQLEKEKQLVRARNDEIKRLESNPKADQAKLNELRRSQTASADKIRDLEESNRSALNEIVLMKDKLAPADGISSVKKDQRFSKQPDVTTAVIEDYKVIEFND